MPLGREVGLGPSDILLDGDQLPSPKRRHNPPIFGPCLLLPNGWTIKMLLGTKVGLGPGHIVLHGFPALHTQKGVQPPPPIFGPCLLWANGRPS